MAKLKMGEMAPDFDLPGVDGKDYTLNSFESAELLVVGAWCNHCPYVIAWEDRAIEIQKDYLDKNVQFIMFCFNNTATTPASRF